MSNHDDYSRSRVPEDQTVSGTEIALIIAGIFIALPAFLAGAEIVRAMGLRQGVLAIAAGALILTVVGVFIAGIAVRSRLSTYMIIQFPFGPLGARGVSLMIGTTLLGWYGVNAALFGRAMETAMTTIYGSSPPLNVHIVLGSILVVGTGIVGFRAIDRLAQAAVPLLLLALLGILYFSTRRDWPDAADGSGTMTLGLAISAVVGAFMVGLTLLPDLLRYARTRRQGVLAVVTGIGVGYPMVLIVSAVPAVVTGESDFLRIMTGLGMGIGAIAIVVFATWTTNISNLYSASLLLATVFPSIPRTWLTVAAGIAGTVVAMLGVLDDFVPFLVFLGAAIPPVAGIYVADSLVGGRRSWDAGALASAPRIGWAAFVSWLAGSAAGLVANSGGFTLTSIPALDSLLIAFGVFAGLSRLARR